MPEPVGPAPASGLILELVLRALLLHRSLLLRQGTITSLLRVFGPAQGVPLPMELLQWLRADKTRNLVHVKDGVPWLTTAYSAPPIHDHGGTVFASDLHQPTNGQN